MTLAVAASAASRAAASCTGATPTWTTTLDHASLTACIANAVDGDTINVGPGTLTLSGGQSIKITNKSISIIGAGIGSSIIIGNDSSAGYGDGSALLWNTKNTGNSPAGFSRLSGFTFKGTAGSNGYAGGPLIGFRGASKNLRFDHNRVEITSTSGMYTSDRVAGVFDHNELVNAAAGLAHQVTATHSNWSGAETSDCGPYTCGDSSWASPSSIGTADNLIFEDNTIQNNMGLNGQYCTDDHVGSRMVYRFNTLVNCTLQTHGTETSGRERGARHSEIYRNSFTWTLGNFPGQITNRGGTGVYFDNTASGAGLQHFLDLSTYRRDDDYDAGGHQGSYPYGRCGIIPVLSITRSGTTATATFPAGGAGHYSNGGGSYQTFRGANQAEYNGTFVTYAVSDTAITFTVPGSPASPATGAITMMSPFDGNTDNTGYPCLDQAGAGQSILYSGGGPSYPPSISPIAPAMNALEPVLTWNNILNGAKSDMLNFGLDVVRENRDSYNQVSGFTGAAGIGVGPLASRPTTCTKGVGYWAVDQGNWNAAAGQDGQFYKCTAANTWSLFYTPFTYPHPLVNAAPPPPPPPPPDSIFPTVSLTAPANAATVSGSAVAVTATAADNIGVAGVQFKIDGQNLGAEVGAAPYSASLNSTLFANGTHALTAAARDAAGNTTTSAAVSVTVSNAAPPPPPPGVLVAAFAFDEGLGTVAADASGQGNTGTLVNGAGWTAGGRFGGALALDGQNDYVNVPNSASINISGIQLTISLWAKIFDTGTADAALIGKSWTDGALNAPYYQYGLEFSAGSKGYYLYLGASDGSLMGPFPTPPAPIGVWTHVAFTYDGSVVKGYIDGVEKSSTPETRSIASRTSSLRMGVDPTLNQAFRDSLDQVRIYSRALSAAEIVSDMNAPIGGETANVMPPAKPTGFRIQ